MNMRYLVLQIINGVTLDEQIDTLTYLQKTGTDELIATCEEIRKGLVCSSRDSEARGMLHYSRPEWRVLHGDGNTRTSDGDYT